MRKRTVLPIFSLLILSCTMILAGCEKEKEPSFSVEEQWQIDVAGQVISGRDERQWKATTFSPEESALFGELDTVSLAGTQKPDGLQNQVMYPFPNPFINNFNFPLAFRNNFTGTIVMKLVIVDADFQVVQRSAFRVSINNGSTGLSVNPFLPQGAYRMYYTLSAEGFPHFHRAWGNIRRGQ